jgi:hypothetical protein
MLTCMLYCATFFFCMLYCAPKYSRTCALLLLYVCFTCMLYLYALLVCFTCMLYLYALLVCFTCMLYLCALLEVLRRCQQAGRCAHFILVKHK